MDIVTHNGKEYKKVAVLAKEFNYTTDYIGQLCRAEKVDARLVGRAWYVNPDSLRNHKKNRYQDTFKERLDETGVASEKPEKHYLERVSVEPVRTNKTVKIIKHIKGSYREVPVQYEADDESLIPHIVKPDVSTAVPVDLAEAEPIKIEKVSTEITELKPEPLPEIYLKGTLSVSDVPEKTSLAVEDLGEEKKTGSAVVVRAKKSLLQPEQTQNQTLRNPIKISKKPLKTSHLGTRTLRPELQRSPRPRQQPSFHPVGVQSKQTKNAPKGAAKQAIPAVKVTRKKLPPKSPHSSGWVWVLLLFLTLLIGAALLSFGTETVIENGVSVTTFSFNFDTLIATLKNLF